MQDLMFIAVVGPTASGKSDVALKLAEEVKGAEIVCCDSVQLYKGFRIGSAAPSDHDLLRAPHHLFGRYAWYDPCDAGQYAHEATVVMREILSRGGIPIVTGGTGLYLRALMGDQWDQELPKNDQLRESLREKSSEELFTELQRLDPRRASELHINDRFRVIRALEINITSGKPVPVSPKRDFTSTPWITVGLSPVRQALHANIEARTSRMLAGGLKQEVEELLKSGVKPDSKPMQSIGYYEMTKHLSGDIEESKLFDLIAASTRQYAKRQSTWFKKLKMDYLISSPNEAEQIFPQLMRHIAGIRTKTV